MGLPKNGRRVGGYDILYIVGRDERVRQKYKENHVR